MTVNSGKMIGVGLAVVALMFGVALWWFQTRAFYERVEGVESIPVMGRGLLVSDYVGIDASTSPLKLRACFRQEWNMANAEPLATATPLVAPDWFECFDAKTIEEDLASGEANAYYAGPGAYEGFDRIVAVYPDGRGYMWRQLNEKYAE